MFDRIWSYITLKFRNSDPQQEVKTAPFSHKRHQTIPMHLPRSLLAVASAQLRQNQSASLPPQYKLVLEPVPSPQPTPQQLQNEQLHDSIIDQVQQLSELVEKLRVSEVTMIEKDAKSTAFRGVIQKYRLSTQQQEIRQIELRQAYEQEIQDFVGFKYSNELLDYPLISFDDYKMIIQYWQSKAKAHLQIKATNFECVQKLTYRAMGGLKFGQWLNDDVINIYIEMMQKRLIKDSNTDYRILNSYFATSTLCKTQNQIQRVLKKKALDKTHRLIMPVNNRNHWYFAVFDHEEIVVYDSMMHHENTYLENPIFKNALKFAKMFYEVQYNLVVRRDYPQQDNCFDCGMFTLLGIRDILRKRQWSFHQGDIKFKRIQIAYQILGENLYFVP